jgi:hypothetical protein
MKQLLLLLLLALPVLAKLNSTCFSMSENARGSLEGDSFSDMSKLLGDQMTLDARISRLIVCMNSKGTRLDGM